MQEWVVSFGGISMKNTQINQGGIGDHSARGHLQRWRDAGIEVACISPVRDDVADFLDADWWPIRPNADVALMLGLAHTLHSEDLHDKAFLRSHCVGYERFVPYLLGESDAVPKDADWAAAICDIEADRIRALARRMASEPCLLSVSWSLQRTENGDQPYWMIAVLGAIEGVCGPGGLDGYDDSIDALLELDNARLLSASLPETFIGQSFPGGAIDHILVAGSLADRFQNASTPDVSGTSFEGSDHRPVIAVLSTTSEETPGEKIRNSCRNNERCPSKSSSMSDHATRTGRSLTKKMAQGSRAGHPTTDGHP